MVVEGLKVAQGFYVVEVLTLLKCLGCVLVVPGFTFFFGVVQVFLVFGVPGCFGFLRC